MIKGIQQAGILLHYYNQNTIQSMKVKKNELETSCRWAHLPELFLEKVVYPFVPMISQRELSVCFAR